MTTRLLDVNVLIALVDPSHVHHENAHRWFAKTGHKSFATCPLTENGLIRIVGHPKYPSSPGPPSVVVRSLRAIRALSGHVFWPDNISVSDESFFSAHLLTSHARVTDSYLVALAQAWGGRLATMDQKLAIDANAGGKSVVEVL